MISCRSGTTTVMGRNRAWSAAVQGQLKAETWLHSSRNSDLPNSVTIGQLQLSSLTSYFDFFDLVLFNRSLQLSGMP